MCIVQLHDSYNILQYIVDYPWIEVAISINISISISIVGIVLGVIVHSVAW